MCTKGKIIINDNRSKISIFFPEPDTINSKGIHKLFVLKNPTYQKRILFQEHVNGKSEFQKLSFNKFKNLRKKFDLIRFMMLSQTLNFEVMG